METKKTGISRDLIIHPGETIAEVLEDRGITQAELATQTGVSPAYISNVISGKKDISGKFAMGLEYALGVPKSFWLNLQANYEAELLEFNEKATITEEEREVKKSLRDVIKHLRINGVIQVSRNTDETILSLRKALQMSNLVNLKDLVSGGVFRMSSNTTVDPCVLGAWLRLCQISGEKSHLDRQFRAENMNNLISEIKQIMLDQNNNLLDQLTKTMQKYGIDFSIAQNFRGAPVHGYISRKSSGAFQMVLTIRGAFADIFWFSLFHEIGHIANGDVTKTSKFIDVVNQADEKELAADTFARDVLLDPESYEQFIGASDFSIDAICKYAAEQDVMPYIVIGRLQKEKYLAYSNYSAYKLRYKWADRIA